MPLPVFIVIYAAGAAVLALWVDVRFPRLGPGSMRVAGAHVIAAMTIAQLVSVPIGTMLDPAQPQRTAALLVTIVLPTLVYAFLTGLWMFKICQRMLGGAVR